MGITRRPVRPGTGKYTGSITGKAVLRTVSEVVEIEIRRTMMERGKEAPVAATKNGRIAVEREREAPEAAIRPFFVAATGASLPISIIVRLISISTTSDTDVYKRQAFISLII